jgi:FMN phosphatase YigB (HAD superfamily)
MQLFFDLDDTLVDTFHLLIDPLERTAADAIAALLAGAVSRDDLHRELMRLHACDPTAIDGYLRGLSPPRATDVVAAHAAIFRDFDVTPLRIESAVTGMLAALGETHTLVLLTEGHPDLQARKVHHLGIASCFDFIDIVASNSEATKEAAIRDRIRNSGAEPAQTIVIGNRIDREIAAGQAIGTHTIWVRSGEGSGFATPERYARPTATVDGVLDVPQALRLIGRNCGSPRP